MPDNLPHRLSKVRPHWDGPTPVSVQFDDPYYSREDPLGEVRHTFLEGANLREKAARGDITIGETGFGTGLNFLAAWKAFEDTAPPGAVMTFISVEVSPLSTSDLERAHSPFTGLSAYADALRVLWPGAIPGVHRLSLSNGRVRLILLFGEAEAMLSRQRFAADIWFLDGFAPAKNPEMWRDAVLAQVARLSQTGTRLASFTAAGMVRKGLEAVGFKVEKRPGHGRKRHCITAEMETTEAPPSVAPWCRWPAPVPRGARIAIIGDGIAARCAGRSLGQAGFEAIRVAGPESALYAASTLPRALIAPKLVRGIEPFPLFWRQAFWDAVRELDALSDVWVGSRGLSIPDAKARNTALRDDLAWPEDVLSLDGNDTLSLPAAGSVDVPSLLDQLCGPPEVSQDVRSLEETGSEWCLIGTSGETLLSADVVILACGPAAHGLMGIQSGLRIGAGQMLMARASQPPGNAVLKNGYMTAADSNGVLALGATATGHAALGPVPVSDEATQEILGRHGDSLGDISEIVPWTGLRCDAGDHLPLCGPVQDSERFEARFAGLRHGQRLSTEVEAPYRSGLFAMTGLGARGFQAAFLLADHLTSILTGRPSSLDADIADALLPARFQVRDMKRNQ